MRAGAVDGRTNADQLRVAVVGAGTAGRCVAATFSAAGASVRVFDPDPEALAVLEFAVALELDRVGLDPRSSSRVRPASSVEAAAAGVDIAFEAAPEDRGAKRAALVALSLAAPAGAVIATTSGAGDSALDDVFASLPRADRLVGTLWWGTARPGGLVELIAVETTAAATIDRAAALLEAGGRSVVRVRRDFPDALDERLRRATAAATGRSAG